MNARGDRCRSESSEFTGNLGKLAQGCVLHDITQHGEPRIDQWSKLRDGVTLKGVVCGQCSQRSHVFVHSCKVGLDASPAFGNWVEQKTTPLGNSVRNIAFEKGGALQHC